MKKVYLNELEEKGEELINYSKNNIGKVIEDLKLAPNNLIWQGPSYNSYIKGYNKKMLKLEELNSGLEKIANFLLLAKDNYSSANEKIEKAYEELLAEFKENRE